MKVCLDCRNTFEIPERGRFCPRCRSGVIVDAKVCNPGDVGKEIAPYERGTNA